MKTFFKDPRDEARDLIQELLRPESPGKNFDDPVAIQTEWGQLSSSNLPFRTKKIRISGDRAKVSPTFRLIGVVGLFFVFLLGGHTGHFAVDVSLRGALISIGLIGVLLLVFRQYVVTTVFDKSLGGFRNAWQGQGFAAKRVSGSIKEIHALQMIGKYLPRRTRRRAHGRNTVSGGFRRYELNLVLKDGSRLHLLAHGNGDSLRRDATALASFLDKPLWEHDFKDEMLGGMFQTVGDMFRGR